MIERGVVLSAFGKRGYVWAAYNLAYSIKYYCPEMKITLLHDESFEKDLLDWQKVEFDNLIRIPEDVLYRNGKISPANIKISIYDFLPYQYNLFIDVDAKAMQNLNIIQGRPSFSSSYIIASINTSTDYGRLRYKVTGKGDTLSCIAYAKHLESGEIEEGPEVTMQMAVAEGWTSKSGSKWKTMPQLILICCEQMMMMINIITNTIGPVAISIRSVRLVFILSMWNI